MMSYVVINNRTYSTYGVDIMSQVKSFFDIFYDFIYNNTYVNIYNLPLFDENIDKIADSIEKSDYFETVLNWINNTYYTELYNKCKNIYDLCESRIIDIIDILTIKKIITRICHNNKENIINEAKILNENKKYIDIINQNINKNINKNKKSYADIKRMIEKHYCRLIYFIQTYLGNKYVNEYNNALIIICKMYKVTNMYPYVLLYFTFVKRIYINHGELFRNNCCLPFLIKNKENYISKILLFKDI